MMMVLELIVLTSLMSSLLKVIGSSCREHFLKAAMELKEREYFFVPKCETPSTTFLSSIACIILAGGLRIISLPSLSPLPSIAFLVDALGQNHFRCPQVMDCSISFLSWKSRS